MLPMAMKNKWNYDQYLKGYKMTPKSLPKERRTEANC